MYEAHYVIGGRGSFEVLGEPVSVRPGDFFYTRRGRLDFACASCHVQAAGKTLRAITVSPALGHPTHWPAYRLAWGELGTLHRRFAACSEGMGATVHPPQSRVYRELELGDFDEVRPRIEKHVEEQRDYQVNRHELEPEIKTEIRRRWSWYFEAFGY